MGTTFFLEMASSTTNINGNYKWYSARTQWQTNTNGKAPLLIILCVFICCSIFCPFPT
jgi:hypothetical protein